MERLGCRIGITVEGVLGPVARLRTVAERWRHWLSAIDVGEQRVASACRGRRPVAWRPVAWRCRDSGELGKEGGGCNARTTVKSGDDGSGKVLWRLGKRSGRSVLRVVVGRGRKTGGRRSVLGRLAASPEEIGEEVEESSGTSPEEEGRRSGTSPEEIRRLAAGGELGGDLGRRSKGGGRRSRTSPEEIRRLIGSGTGRRRWGASGILWKGGLVREREREKERGGSVVLEIGESKREREGECS